MKMTTKDVKEITYMPLVTFFNVLERPGKNHKEPPLVRQGLNKPLISIHFLKAYGTVNLNNALNFEKVQSPYDRTYNLETLPNLTKNMIF